MLNLCSVYTTHIPYIFEKTVIILSSITIQTPIILPLENNHFYTPNISQKCRILYFRKIDVEFLCSSTLVFLIDTLYLLNIIKFLPPIFNVGY